ncbi:uncharacterized protein LOC131947337 [Physella acuta]|uniref:uncharacterized protein LOC131947337 n=1 Tax=Physella acuta TaxID=109671 RepID=UPI0027DC0FF0|nr:uncharacterized protein LOC131947337 [Physella acuta]XP_059164510.1 uncharacterized protein LOC131947337 [Physella acuta]XP_059164512.1 uncharacterized protein LOC131947337 [Physella acuta]
MASVEDSLDDHNSMASGEDSLDDHNSRASGEDSLDDHNSKASVEDISTYFTGTHEVQECLEGQGEVDLHTHLASCEKNPGHNNFVPVNQLSLEHFPPGYHDNDVYDLTKVLADVMVRIAVKFTSPDRPEFVEGAEDPYPCYNTRGQNSLHTGTGRMIKCTKGMKRPTDITCPCPECDHSDTPSKVWWEVHVLTARHVLFDDSEARQSSCRLWFDDDKSPVVKIYGWKVGLLSVTERDMCVLYCVTHEVVVADKLEEMVRRFVYLRDKVRDKYESRRGVDKLTIIVSHPHGCSKQVSVGHWVDRQVVRGNLTRYTYTTCTCPGSSGAWVYRLGCDWWSGHPHSGAKSGGLNYSGVWGDF